MRISPKHILIGIICIVLLAAAPLAAAEQVIFVVRHAERADGGAPAGAPVAPGMTANDPPLSAAGEQRAARLASMLAAASVRHIFVTEYRRTAQTAAPLAARLGLTPSVTAARDADALVSQLRRAEGNVLVVGHSNTIPGLLTKLGLTETITLADNDYDDIFVVFRDATGKASLVRLKY
jgi:broad specificity phosphatase PhoE